MSDEQEKESRENKEVEVLFHTISYYYGKDQEIPESEQEHVKQMIIDGYSSGELNDDGNYGWWHIVFKKET